MPTMLDQQSVEGVDTVKVAQAFSLLAESGLPKETLQSIKYEFGIDTCTHCKRSWPRKASSIVSLPPWKHPIKRKEQKPNGWYTDANLAQRHLSPSADSELPQPPVEWWKASTCPSCTLAVGTMLGEFIAISFPKKALNAFLRILHYTVGRQKDEYEWKRERRYDGYVAVTNAIMQHTKPEGNARAMALLIDISHDLGLL
jgi:hypothetical protein